MPISPIAPYAKYNPTSGLFDVYDPNQKSATNPTGKISTTGTHEEAARMINPPSYTSPQLDLIRPATEMRGEQKISIFNPDINKELISGYKSVGFVPQSTTVASPEQGQQYYDAEVSRLNSLKSSRGTSTNAQGYQIDVNGDLIPAPSGAQEIAENVWQDTEGRKYGTYDTGNAKEIYEHDPIYEMIRNETDSYTKWMMENIQRQYGILKQQQDEINKSQEAGRMRGLLMSGGQYTPLQFTDVMALQKTSSLRKIAALDAEEMNLLAQAKQAQSQKNIELMSNALNRAEAVRKERQAVAQKESERISAENAKLQERERQANNDALITKAISTIKSSEPSAILNELRNQGATDITMEEITSYLKSVADLTGAKSEKQINSALEAFYDLKDRTGGLPTDILALPDEASRMFEFLKRYNAATAKVAGGTGGTTGGTDDTETIADAIVAGRQPPVVTGLYGKTAAVRAALERRGYDYSKANQDWTATQKLLATLNGAQQTRLRQAVNFTYDSLDIVEELNTDAENAMARAGITEFAKVQRLAAVQGVFGQEVKSAFTKLDNQVSDLISELATVYKGGNSSTDESLELAAMQLSSNWDYQTLKDNIELVRKNLAIRKNSLNLSTGGISDSKYNPMESSPINPLNVSSGGNATTTINNPLNLK